MSRVLTQAQAEQDLLEIWLYTFNEWGEQQADIYLEWPVRRYGAVGRTTASLPRATGV